MADPRPGVELCAASYRASRLCGTVFVFADGVHPTTGYHAFWMQDAPDRAPAELSLWHVRPTGPALQVATPFAAATSFQTLHDVRSVKVRDAAGVHVVQVMEAADLVAHKR